MGQAAGRLAQIGAAGGLDAFEHTAHRRVIQVQGEDFVLRQAGFELHGAEDLAGLAGDGARRRFQNTGDLHGEGRAARDNAAACCPLAGSTQQGEGIDPGMPAEVAILVAQQGFPVEGRDFIERDRVTPHVIAVGEGAQRRAVAGHDEQRVGRIAAG